MNPTGIRRIIPKNIPLRRSSGSAIVSGRMIRPLSYPVTSEVARSADPGDLQRLAVIGVVHLGFGRSAVHAVLPAQFAARQVHVRIGSRVHLSSGIALQPMGLAPGPHVRCPVGPLAIDAPGLPRMPVHLAPGAEPVISCFHTVNVTCSTWRRSCFAGSIEGWPGTVHLRETTVSANYGSPVVPPGTPTFPLAAVLSMWC
ncbi:hypothetical protein LCGC14_0320080 [marine sediment metagenome]|uniref:Uncharacterized protein n=1 Tax=marine sediment metagenome TaxID=412755 RepID=A0A0F9TJL3_9ZZZZ